jgi:ribosomal protein S18 acetylase RimI-like enzyme
MDPDKPMSQMRRPGDERARHFGISINETIVGIVSLYNQNPSEQKEEGYWRIRGMAIRQDLQGRGLGTKLLEFALSKIGPIKVLWCNSRENAVDYYKKFGMEEVDMIKTGDPNHPIRYRMVKNY